MEYPGTVPGKVLSFVGCHMDVVTANPDDWVCFYTLCFLVSMILYGRFVNTCFDSICNSADSVELLLG